MRRFFLASILLLISGTANAAGPAPAATQPPQTGQQQATRIETDQKTGAVWIIVDGRKVVRIDRTGLYVTGDVNYTGVLTDGAGATDTPHPEAKP